MKNNTFTVDNLVIEITRQCQLNCSHCLRGDSQKIDMSKTVINKIASLIRNGMTPRCITITGGDPFHPSCRTSLIYLLKYLRNLLKENLVSLIYVKTNGVSYSSEAMELLVDINAIYLEEYNDAIGNDSIKHVFRNRTECIEGTGLMLYISNDIWHDEEIEANFYQQYRTNLSKYASFSFVNLDEKYMIDPSYLINEGSCDFGGRILEDEKIQNRSDFDYDYFDGTEVYINVHGDVILGCDWSYESQDKKIIGNILKENLHNILLKEAVIGENDND